jgi:hypothetical protein
MENIMKTEVVNIRVTPEEKMMLQERADHFNFRSISEYLRFVGLNYSNLEIRNNEGTIEMVCNGDIVMKGCPEITLRAIGGDF